MVITNMKLKIKFGASKPAGATLSELVKKGNTGDNGEPLVGDVNGENELNNMRSCGLQMFDHRMTPTSANMQPKSSILGAKRVLEGAQEVPMQKGLKMDRSMTSKCSGILKKLMNHSSAWVFKMPVDPVALNIPDYFSIISRPMDLGTIESKLKKNVYYAADEFKSDVRLTFANAILYNPPTNRVHQMAKDMDAYFDSLWRHVGANTSRTRLDVIPKVEDTGKCDVGNTCAEKQPSEFERVPKRMKRMDKGASAERIQKSNTKAVNDGNCKCSKETKVLRSVADFSGAVICRTEENSRIPSIHADIFMKGTGRLGENMKIEGMKGASLRKQNTQASETEVAKSWNCPKSPLVRSNPDSDGAVSSLEDEGSCAGSNVRFASSVGASEDREEPVIDLQLSPERALRAAKLKKRFAATILRAQQKTLLHHDGKTDATQIEQEKRRFEKQQDEEEARIEARMIALRRQRQQEREAARCELERMEKSVDIDDNLYILRDLETLVGDCSTCYSHSARRCNTVLNHFEDGRMGSPLSPLERLGLFIKAEYNDDDDDGLFPRDLDLEEGELLCR